MKFGGTGGRPWSGLEGLYGIPPGQDGLGRTVGMAPGYLRGIPVVPPNFIKPQFHHPESPGLR